MVSGIQLFGALFGLFLTYFTFLNYKRQEFTLREFIGWELLWCGFILVTLAPQAFEVFAGDLGAVRPLDLFSVIGFMVVLMITYYNYVNVDRIRKKLEKTIRDLAIEEWDGRDRRSKKR